MSILNLAFASGGVSPKTVAQVGGVRKLKLTRKGKRPCVCRKSEDGEEKCFSINCNRRQRFDFFHRNIILMVLVF